MRNRPAFLTAALCPLALVLLLPAASPAASEPAVDDGIRLVGEGDYDAAIVVLDGAVRKLSGDPKKSEDLVQAYLYLGVAFVGKAHEEAAKRQFRSALRLQEGIRLSAADFPPKIIGLFEAARQEEQRDATARVLAEERRPNADAKGKGGGQKWLLIGGGLAAAAGGGIALAGGGSSDSGTGGGSGAGGGVVTTPRPTVGALVEPLGTAIVSVTQLTFRATASNASGPVSWDFGDGSSWVGDTVTHTYQREGIFVATATATGAGGNATATVEVRVGSVTGTWVEGCPGCDGFWTFLLEQRGSDLRANLRWGLANADYPFDEAAATLRHPRDLTITQPWACGVTIAGTFDTELRRMSGTASRPACDSEPAGSETIVLDRQ